jgi:amino acid adenylation domain-containing protein
MNKRNIEDIYPLSPMQEGMLFHSLYSGETGVYFEQLTCRLEGALNLEAFKETWRFLLRKYPVLRSSFVWKNTGTMSQVVHVHAELPITEYDWQHLSEEEQTAELISFLEEDRKQGFDMNKAPLMRLALAHLSEKNTRFILSHHHLLLDGWSLPLVMKDLMLTYERYARGKEPIMERVTPYRDYIRWLKDQDMGKAEVYWKEELAGFSSPTTLTVDRNLKVEDDGFRTVSEEEILLPVTVSRKLEKFARQHKVTISTVLQSAWTLLLSRYSGEMDILYGLTVSGRSPELAKVEKMAGLFINTLPVRVEVKPEESFADWIEALQDQLMEIQQYAYCPLVKIQSWSEIPPSYELFTSIFVFENYPVDRSLKSFMGSLRIKDVQSMEQTNYALTVVASPGRKIPIKISYDRHKFTAIVVKRILGHLEILLTGVAEAPETKIVDLPLLTVEEKQQLLVTWNETTTPYEKEICVHQAFERQAAQTPQAVALKFEGEALSYREVNEQANQLAHYLLKKGVQEGEIVAICLPRSPQLVISELATLKAGAVFLPIDHSYPLERIEYMLDDSEAVFLIRNHDDGQLDGTKEIVLDDELTAIAAENAGNPDCQTVPQSDAYVIYTSGSTGKPKGVLLKHEGLVNFCKQFNDDLKINAHSHVLQFASCSFDASLAEIFPALSIGGTVVLAQRETLLDMDALYALLKGEKISVVTMPPSLLRILPTEGLDDLATVASVGEACTVDVVNKWAPGRVFLNGYGPTETTIGAIWGEIEIDPEMSNVPIGKAIGNSKIYILDSKRIPVPIGVPGEIYIGGVGVAVGYLNRPELTAERFLPDPYQKGAWQRMYRSGDLARFREDGRIEFLGRVDRQVKLRGFRIELGEIEAMLDRLDEVQQAVVTVHDVDRNEKKLSAYILLREGCEWAPKKLRSTLMENMPAYMVPAVYTQLDEVPLTSSGKVDFKRLPQPSLERSILDHSGFIPRSPVEQGLLDIWRELLGLEQIGMRESFLELGGHSLLVTQLVARIRKIFQVELALRQVFEYPTIAGQAEQIESAMRENAAFDDKPIEKASRDELLPLSFSQQRLWFLDQLSPGNLFYNIPEALELEGDLNLDALRYSLNALVDRHESLRTVFTTQDGMPRQMIHPEWEMEVPLLDLSEMEAAEREAIAAQEVEKETQTPFDLETGPLVRLRLLKMAADKHIALLNMHHIVADGWSMGIFVHELAAFYEARCREEIYLPDELPLQYADYAVWQRNWLKDDVLEKQLAYWHNKLGEKPLVLDLPTDHPRPAMMSQAGSLETFTMPDGLYERLNAFCKRHNVTLFMVLLAAYQTMLYRYTGQEQISVGTAIANRNRTDIEGLIGFFVNTLVLKEDLNDEMTFKVLLQKVRETCLGAFAHQDLPFELLVEEMQPERNLSYTPLFQAAFSMQTGGGEPISFSGITWRPLSTFSGTAKFDITLGVTDDPKNFNGYFEYSTDLFEQESIQRMAGHFLALLEGLLVAPETEISRLPLLTTDERQLMLRDWNDAMHMPVEIHCAHELFASQAVKHPERTALRFQGQSLSYGELDSRANKLAQYLVKAGVKPVSLVGISTERSLETVIGILGVMKAGGAYLPLDPTYPADRIQFMLEDSRVEIVLTQEKLLEQFAAYDGRLIPLDAAWPEIASEADQCPESGVQPDDLAYVIYTSGSTGRPKGTLLAHRGLCNLTRAQKKAFEIDKNSHVLQFAPLSFDASVWETFMALANGGTLVLAPQEVLASAIDLMKLLQEEQVTNVTLPPSVLKVLPPTDLPDLRTVVSAGEACNEELVKQWAPGRDFFNAYGPTETTVCASFYLCSEEDSGPPPIGKPLANTALYVLDRNMQPVPVGVPGELHVGGVSLALGYLNRPEMTEDRFVKDPFGDESADRLYKTGDLVRYRPNGDIEFLGRIDHQVKVHGFRIELGEVEEALRRHEALQDMVVVARDDPAGGNRLVAFLVSAAEEPPTVGQLRGFLLETLPDYMVPSVFVYLDTLPLTPNGKVDRNALPEVSGERPEMAREYVAPRNDLEAQLAEMAGRLLGLDQVGVEDNFFELGGHSLLAAQFISRVRESLGVEVPLRVLFEKATIGGIAAYVEEAQNEQEETQAVVDDLLVHIDQLSDEEVERLLNEREMD